MRCRPVRILFANKKLDYGSATSYSLDLAQSLITGGDVVQFCTAGGPLWPEFRERGFETYLAKFNYFSYRKLIQYLRDLRPDLIHIQNQRSAAFGQKLSSRLGVPHIVTVHRSPHGPATSLAHPLLAGVVAVNEVIRETLVNNQAIPKSLIRVIKHGVNVESLRPSASESSRDGSERIPVVGAVGRLTAIKGHHLLLSAARKVLDAGVEVMFMLVGEGDEEPGLRRLARELKLERHVTFSPHIPSRKDLYRIFDIVVVPTLRGGVGTTALEAMAMGKPVVASAVGEVLHVLRHEETGWLVPESDATALADGILRLVRDRPLAERLAAAAREHVCENFALDSMVKGTRVFYQDVLATLAERPVKV